MTKKIKSFTLIELLVVVTIIGILASILAPSLRKAIGKARIAVCLNNHKQIGIAMALYTTEENDAMPVHSSYYDVTGLPGWSAIPEKERPLYPYLEGATAEVNTCPSDIGCGTSKEYNTPVWKMSGSSYQVQYAGSGHNNIGVSTNVGGRDNMFLSRFDDPVFKITTFPMITQNNCPWKYKQNRWHSESQKQYPVGFVDGHAKYFLFWWGTSDTPPHGKNLDRDGYY